MKRPDEILSRYQVCSRLPSDRRVHLRQQGCWNLYHRHAAHENRRQKSAQVPDDTAAEGDHQARAVRPGFDHLLRQALDGGHSLVLFPAWKKQRLARASIKGSEESLTVQSPHIRRRNDEELARLGRHAPPQFTEGATGHDAFILGARRADKERGHKPVVPWGISTDFLIVGAGVAGLRAAIELAPFGSVFILAKDQLKESSSEYAQGGIAAALSDDDEITLHEQDTIAAGDGLCNPEAVHTLVEEGPRAIEELIAWGAEFDREGSRLAFAREGAHSRSRVLHAHGDSTGREISRTLGRKASTFPSVSFASFTAITELLLDDGEVVGAVAFDEGNNREIRIAAKAVLLATGGLGRLYQATTNPDVATGDGIALAYRAGAEISDLEFVQFHPTALHVPGAPSFLLSEALRGEGAKLRNIDGEAFMEHVHPMADLAPRDVVARAIVAEMIRTGQPHVLLDLTHREPGFVAARFPRIYETCLRHGIDLATEAAPVHPAAHYAMGGVRTDLDGRTNLAGLYAAGEAACNGVHGANRLASNSLLEGLVYGARAGRAMRDLASAELRHGIPAAAPRFPQIAEPDLRSLTWRHAGITRSAEGLTQLLSALEAVPMTAVDTPGRSHFEIRNMHLVAVLLARCALARRESRGAHFRADCPLKSEDFQKHSLIGGAAAVPTFY
jgi:L-aspartate oxidase